MLDDTNFSTQNEWKNIQKFYNYVIYDLEDPRIKDVYLISSPVPTIVIIITYVLLIYNILPNYMRNRRPFHITNLIRIYNICQIIACSTIVYQTVTPLSNPLYVWRCERFSYSTDSLNLRRVNISYFWYLLKAVELLETIFFTMKKKFNQVSTLHVYHHISTFVTAWIAGKYISGGLTSFCHLLNSSVHVVMYLYYFLTTLNLQWQKSLLKWKPYLTLLQIAQLVTLIGHGSQAIVNKNCNVHSFFFYMYGLNVSFIVCMFLNFYKNSYRTKKIQ